MANHHLSSTEETWTEVTKKKKKVTGLRKKVVNKKSFQMGEIKILVFVYKQLNTVGGEVISTRVEEEYSCTLETKTFQDLVKLMKSPIRNEAASSKVSAAFDKSVLSLFVESVVFGHRLTHNISKKIQRPDTYAYRATYSGPLNGQKNIKIYEVGLNYGASKNIINFCLKVCDNGVEEFSSYEWCAKTFKKESYYFNIHIEASDFPPTFTETVKKVLSTINLRKFTSLSNKLDMKLNDTSALFKYGNCNTKVKENQPPTYQLHGKFCTYPRTFEYW